MIIIYYSKVLVSKSNILTISCLYINIKLMEMDFYLLQHGLVNALNGLIKQKRVITWEEAAKGLATHPGAMIKMVNVDAVFEQFYQRISSRPRKQPMPVENAKASGSPAYTIYIKVLAEKTVKIEVNALMTIGVLKQQVHLKIGIHPEEQRLIYGGKQLDDNGALADYGISAESTLHLVLRLRGGFLGGGPFLGYIIGLDYLDPQYDFDFRYIEDDNQIYYRNNFVYTRPLGSMRHAIRVIGKYSDDDWLGPNGIRDWTDGKEWPVAYHGTLEMNALAIVKGGFCLEKAIRHVHGKAIYCTPNPKAALYYAAEFEYEGKMCRLVLQTRVNPEQMRIVRPKKGKNTDHSEYWLLRESDAIRPYGVCIYEM